MAIEKEGSGIHLIKSKKKDQIYFRGEGSGDKRRRSRSGGASFCKMGRGKALCWWCLVLLTLLLTHDVSGGAKHEEEEACAPSRCGKIENISPPFRLRDDPAECGDPRYVLHCENNVTVLHLYSGKYYVLGINYDNYTIRVVDPGIQQADCSSLPRYFLYRLNFSDFRSDSISDAGADPYSTDLDDYTFEHIIYLNCSNPVRRNDAGYVDTASCLNLHSKGHIYAIPGDLGVGNLSDQCRVKWVTPITRAWRSFLRNENFSYADIHKVLSYGFELSWWRGACACSISGFCYFDSTTRKVQCGRYCFTPLDFEKPNCGPMTKLRIFAEDYLIGIRKGIFQIGRVDPGYLNTDYRFGLSQLGVDMGVVTGRFLLPLISVRFLLGIIFLLVLLICTCRKRHLSMFEDIENFLQLHDLMPVRYSYKELKMMTKGFKIKLGEGGFGTVYRGKLRSGPHVAIKMLGNKSKANGQEFISEVATIGRIHHFNVVRLVGFCVEGTKRALVYEYMSNGSLDKYIFSKEESILLNYEKIYEISLGVARGIAYLHHGCDMQILHFDIKPHNILLNDNFIPKVSDFGLAKLYPVDDSIVTLTAARGTIGYMAPELFYQNIGGVSYKADVYSFGMLLMEMASRRKNLNPHTEHSNRLYFPFWIYDQFTQEKDIEMEDLTKEEKDLAKKMFIIALWCIQLKPIDRPSMKRVVEMLESEVESLEMPPKPSLYPDEAVVQDDRSNCDQTSSVDTIHTSSNPGEIASDDE